jgi:spermidine/putrescine transport system permease protein
MTTFVADLPERAARSQVRQARLRLLLCFGPPALYVLVFMVLPYLNMFAYTFFSKQGYTVIPDFQFASYQRLFSSGLYADVLLRSLWVALIVTVGALVIAYPTAFYMAFVARKRKRLLYFLIIVPLWSSFLLRVFIWKLILGKEGIINSFLLYLDVIDEPLSIILYNQFSVSLTLIYIFVPFMVLPIFTALEKIPRHYIEASMDLGGHPFQTFRRVILPLSMPGVIAGCVFAFCLTLGDFVSPTLLGGPSGIMISNIVLSEFITAFEWPFGSTLALAVLLVILVVLAIAFRLERRSDGQIV